MSNPYTGAVASALRKCQLLLETETATTLARTALHEGAVLQLWRAYRAFLAELAFQLQLGGAGCEPESAQALAESADAADVICGQAVELQELSADPDTWLAQLQAAWVHLWSFSAENAGENKGNRSQAANLIPLQNLSAPAPVALNDQLLRDWHAALSELIRRQRAQTEEW